jgi:ribonuclease P protein component
MKEGVRFSVSGAKLFILASNLSHNRIAFTFSHKFGIAVERNRARRLGREAWRRLPKNFPAGYDFVLLVYPEAKDSGKIALKDRLAQLEMLLKKAQL